MVWRVRSQDILPKSKAPAQTFEEARYLKRLTETGRPVVIKLVTNEEYRGTIEFWDAGFIRLSREDGPNLFIYKDQIKYLAEVDQD
jgi:sRNA-binding regulator protein Hfq